MGLQIHWWECKYVEESGLSDFLVSKVHSPLPFFVFCFLLCSFVLLADCQRRLRYDRWRALPQRLYFCTWCFWLLTLQLQARCRRPHGVDVTRNAPALSLQVFFLYFLLYGVYLVHLVHQSVRKCKDRFGVAVYAQTFLILTDRVVLFSGVSCLTSPFLFSVSM